MLGILSHVTDEHMIVFSLTLFVIMTVPCNDGKVFA